MAFWRPFRRPNRDLGTLGGNPSMLDEVNAEGPPVLPGVLGGLAGGVGYWEMERTAAVQADIESDISSDFDAVTNAEEAEVDALESDRREPADNAD